MPRFQIARGGKPGAQSLPARVPQSQKHARGDQHAVGVDGDGAELKENRVHLRLCERNYARSCVGWLPPVSKKLEHHESRADHDGRIRDVERVPVMAAHVKIDEIGDAAPHDAIEHVSRRAAQNQRQVRTGRASCPRARSVRSSQASSTITATEKRISNGASHASRRIGQQAKCHAGIAGVHQIQRAGNQHAQMSPSR